MADSVRIQVLLGSEDAARFENYCREHGHKKSTLIARLVRELLDREGYPEQGNLFSTAPERERRQK